MGILLQNASPEARMAIVRQHRDIVWGATAVAALALLPGPEDLFMAYLGATRAGQLLGRLSGRLAAAIAGEPGTWRGVNEAMSARAAAYQIQAGGRAGQAYFVNGVKFDSFRSGVLIDAKGPGYAQFVKNGQFVSWFKGSDELVGQAQRQLAAARGSAIKWEVAEESAAKAIRKLFDENHIRGIDWCTSLRNDC